jgi:competence protein ComFC
MTTSGDTPISCFALRCSSRLLQAGRRWLAALAAVAFPPHCYLCGQDLPRLEILCQDCATSLPVFGRFGCRRCGEPLDDPSVDLCLHCGTRAFSLDRVISLGPYHQQWGCLVRAFKFDREMAIGRWLGGRLAEQAACERASFDVVTYVPMTARDRRRRGFNQAEILARAVARSLDLPLARMLDKVRATPLQSRLSARSRSDNLRDAFRRLPCEGDHVLLVDDIYTTGATVEECARTLKRGGAQTVVALTVARA